MIGYPGYFCDVCGSWIPVVRIGILEVVMCGQCGTIHSMSELSQYRENGEDE